MPRSKSKGVGKMKGDLDKNEIYITIVNTLVLLLVFIIFPLILFIYQLSVRIQMMTDGVAYSDTPVIEKIFNKLTYGRIRNV